MRKPDHTTPAPYEFQLSDFINKTKIGDGKFATVYSAICINNTDAMFVALKEKTNENQQSLKNELNILSNIESHIAIIRLYGVLNGSLVLELMQNDLLTILVNQFTETGDNLLTSKSITQILYNIAIGLNHLHEKKILHRDVKPENILINIEKENLIAKLADFGLSENCEQSNGWSTQFSGSRFYAAPELLTRKTHNSAIDIYAFGVGIFALSSGLSMPSAMGFNQTNSFLYSIVSGKRAKLSILWNHGLQKLLTQMLHQDPSKRPSANEIATILSNKNAHFLFKHVDDDPKYKKYNAYPLLEYTDDNPTYKKYDENHFLTTLIQNSIHMTLNYINHDLLNKNSNVEFIEILQKTLTEYEASLKKTIEFQPNSQSPKKLYMELTETLKNCLEKQKILNKNISSQIRMTLGYLLAPSALLRHKIFIGNMNDKDIQHVEKIISITSPSKWLTRYYKNKNLTEPLAHAIRIIDSNDVNHKELLLSEDPSIDHIYSAKIDNTPVVIKEECTDAKKSALTNETYLLKKLQICPQIVKLLGITIINGTVFSIFLEKLETDLWTLIENARNTSIQSHPLTATTTHSIFTQIVFAITFMHALSIMHRDINPANILIDSKNWTAKLGDFGLAKNCAQQQSLTSKKICGTPEYMAPEITSGIYTEAVDVYGLALTMLQTAALDIDCDAVTDEWDNDLKNIIFSGLEINPDDRPSIQKILMTMDVSPMLFKHFSHIRNNNNHAAQENNNDSLSHEL